MFQFDYKKAIEIILFIAEKTKNVYNLLKIMYYADREHISKYGRSLCGDHYVKMSYGPVPSGSYDLIKEGKGIHNDYLDYDIKDSFTVKNNHVQPNRKPEMKYLSQSDIECLEQVIKTYGFLSFGELKDKSHKEDTYVNSYKINKPIEFELFIKSLPNGDEIYEYLLQG